MKELLELNKDLQREIDNHKWIESQKAGKDLNGHAIEDWLANHFKNWKKHQWEKCLKTV